jgi:hypothetical protein
MTEQKIQPYDYNSKNITALLHLYYIKITGGMALQFVLSDNKTAKLRVSFT